MKKNRSIKSRRPAAAQKSFSPWKFWSARIVLFLSASLLTTAALVLETDLRLGAHNFRVGEPAPRTLFAPFEVNYVNEERTEQLRREAQNQIPPIFRDDSAVKEGMTRQVDELFETLNEARTRPEDAGPVRALPFEVSEASMKYLLTDGSLEDIRKNVQLLIEQIVAQGIVADQDREKVSNSRGEIWVLAAGAQTPAARPAAQILTLGQALEKADQILNDAGGRKRNLKSTAMEIFGAVAAPNLVYDAEATQGRKGLAAQSVAPVQETVKKDELVVQRGMIVTAREKREIDMIQKKRAEKEVLKKLSATGLIVFLTYFLLAAYLLFFQKKLFRSLRMVLLLLTVFVINVLLCKIIRVWPESSAYLIPGALAPLLLALLVEPRFGLVGSIIMACLAAPMADFRTDVILAILLSGVAGTFAAHKVRRRVQFLRVGFIVGFASFAVIFALQLFEDRVPLEAVQIAALGFVNGFLITMPCLFLLLAVFEAVFNLATDITLLELSDLNHPLLKRMIIEAPGTYHHSLVVSRLAEAACEEIGANALLARVGCYFHDIGKMARSEFFTENQNAQYPSKHEKLTPTMSCLVIINHVKDGLELGRKYKLKQSVLNFIPEHQGTGIVYYFYRKAQDQAAPGEKLDPNDFRYPGPKPQSRETAIALLADSTEAASRSLKNPSPESIASLVRKIINDKFIDGQLDECDLTLKDLHKIQESFVHNLMAIYHTRVSYPDQPKDEDRPDIFAGNQFQKFRFKPS